MKATAPEEILTAVITRKRSDLSFPEVVFEECALTVGEMAFERWLKLGQLLGKMEKGVQFWIGDYLNAGEKAYAEKFSQAVDERQAATWMNYAWVARRVDKTLRKEIVLSYKHHEVVAPLAPAEQEKWLADAVKNKWGVHEFRANVKAAKQPRLEEGAVGEIFYTVPLWQKLPVGERRKIIDVGFDSGRSSMNRQESESVGWARFSLNTVTGCLHDCPYCYARDIAERMFSYGFEPVFHPARLASPANARVPVEAGTDPSFKNIFVNSMSDLFGQWVPADWIEATIEMASRNPQWNFLALTKFPIRAAEFEFPENFWLGTTVDAQARVGNAERAFAKIRCKTKWLSCEPLLTPLEFKRLDLFQWIVIGGSSRSTRTPEWFPPFDWIVDLHRQARKAGCKIYHKTNLFNESSRIEEFPWMKREEKQLPEAFQYLKGI